jgi:hypothetical protein
MSINEMKRISPQFCPLDGKIIISVRRPVRDARPVTHLNIHLIKLILSLFRFSFDRLFISFVEGIRHSFVTACSILSIRITCLLGNLCAFWYMQNELPKILTTSIIAHKLIKKKFGQGTVLKISDC